MLKSKSLKHAEHNLGATLCVHEQHTYHDWVVTMAFYSALHFINHKLFPSKPEGYLDFHDYYISVVLLGKRKYPQHKARARLVDEKMPVTGMYYRWLLQTADHARYNDWNISADKARVAIKYLTLIQQDCCEEEPAANA